MNEENIVKEQRKPTWWQLYAIAGLAILLLFLEAVNPFSPLEHEMLQFIIVVAIFGLLSLWMLNNGAALEGRTSYREQRRSSNPSSVERRRPNGQIRVGQASNGHKPNREREKVR